MNIVIIVAGGSGVRMHMDTPKQFVVVDSLPIIMHSMLKFQSLDFIDEIVTVIPNGWDDFVSSYVKQYNITKLSRIVHGGATRLDSVYNALLYLKNKLSTDDIIGIMDANRPLTPLEVIEKCFEKAKNCDCVLPLDPSFDTLYYSSDGVSIHNPLDRNTVFKGQGPETARFGIALDVYEQAKQDGILDRPMGELILHYGKQLVGTQGSVKSFKITTADDLELFKAYLRLSKKEEE